MAFHHKNQGSNQAADDGDESDENQVLHRRDYHVISPWKFWLFTGITLLACTLTLALGRWQLSRAEQKQALVDHMEMQASLPPVDIRVLLTEGKLDSAYGLHRRVFLRGRWLASHTVFLDNRAMAGKAGFYVVTPLQLEGVLATILVQRGWAARNFLDRSSLPTVDTPAGIIELQGRVVPPPSKLYEFKGSDTGRIRQNLDMAAFSAEIGVPLPGVSVQQMGRTDDGLQREWSVLEASVQKHYGYAFQWFSLSGLIALLYFWFQIVRRFIYPRRT